MKRRTSGGPWRPYPCRLSLCEFYELYSSWFQRPCILVFSISPGSYTFLDFFLMEVAESWRKVFSGDIPFRTEYSRDCHSLSNIWLWFSTFIPTCCRRRLLWRWLIKALIYKNSEISMSQFISLFLHGYCWILPLIPTLSSLRLLVNWTVPSLGSISWSSS